MKPPRKRASKVEFAKWSRLLAMPTWNSERGDRGNRKGIRRVTVHMGENDLRSARTNEFDADVCVKEKSHQSKETRLSTFLTLTTPSSFDVKRHSFGRRTAWLRPFLQIFAVSIASTSCDLYHGILHPLAAFFKIIGPPGFQGAVTLAAGGICSRLHSGRNNASCAGL